MKSLKEYQSRNKRVAQFGNTYLDYKLRGILQGDLILIGARSGAGKSTIAETIAFFNAQNGIKVTLISLENFEGDNFINSAYYKYKEESRQWDLNLRDFASGEFDVNEIALKKAEEYTKRKFENINLVTRQSEGITIDRLEEIILDADVNKHSELIIIDHLDYFDKYDKQTDNEHMTGLMSTIRDAQYKLKIPIVAISHLRKLSARDVIVPNEDEFLGSSNKVKQSTIVITFAPDVEANMRETDKCIRHTFCSVRKLRLGGCDNTVAKLHFDTKTGAYTSWWAEYNVDYLGTKISETTVNTSRKEEEKRK